MPPDSDPSADQKNYLDTSVARPMLTGSSTYRNYFASQFASGKVYASAYIRMELRRSLIRNLIEFYTLLRMPEVPSLADAIAHWSDRYKSSEAKAALQLISALVETHQIGPASQRSKERAQTAIASAILRYDRKIRRMATDTGVDGTRCARARVALSVDLANPAAGFEAFVTNFNDVVFCRSQCAIDDFLLRKKRGDVDKIVAAAANARGQEARGYRKIASELEESLTRAGADLTCKKCERIGDAVIAIDAPRAMRLEHTDNSHDYLCPAVKQPHFHHPSQTAHLNQLKANDATSTRAGNV